MRELGTPLGLGPREAAAAVYRIVTANMSSGVRAVTVERGQDPRDFSMLAYGGAIGIFATDIARSLGIRRVILPPEAAVFSAQGLLASDDVRTLASSVRWSGGPADDVIAKLRALDEQLLKMLRDVGHSPEHITVEWQGDFKFAGQQWELRVPIPRSADIDASHFTAIQAGFAERYEAEYGPGTAWVGSPVILGSVRVVATGAIASFEPAMHQIVCGAATPVGRRQVYLPMEALDAEVDVYQAADLRPGSTFVGPAVLEQGLTTVQIGRGWSLEVDAWQNCVLTDAPEQSDTHTGTATDRHHHEFESLTSATTGGAV